jgi:hypothetical protein
MKRCGKCNDFLEENQFSFSKGRLQSFCRECQSKYAEEYRKKNKQKLVNSVKKWRENNNSDRKLSDLQKHAEDLRQRVRRLLTKDSDDVDETLGYSANQLKAYLVENFGSLPDKEHQLKYIKTISLFNLSDINTWKDAAALKNIQVVKKNT